MPRTRNVLAGALVGCWAAFVRTLAVFEALRSPFLDKYPQAARRLLAGELTPERWLDFSPFYLGLSSAVTAMGLPVRETLLILQAGAGVAASLVAFELARRWAGLVAGVAAGLLMGSSRMVVVGGALLEPEIWLGLGLLLGLLGLEQVAARSAETGLDSLRLVEAGFCFAAAAWVRPNALIVPVLLLALAVVFRRGAARHAAWITGVALGGFALGMAFWLGPRVTPEEWSALMSPGQVFHQGNARDASGFGLHYPVSVRWSADRFGAGRPDFEHQAYRDVARAATGECLSLAQAERFWRSKAREAMGKQPWEAVERAGQRLLGTLHRRQVWDVAAAARLEARLAWSAPVQMPVLLPLALVAFVLPGRRRLLFLLPILVLPFLTATVFFASGRHRLLLDLGLAIAAGVGVARLCERFRRKATWSPAQAGAVLAALVLGCLVPFVPLDPVERNRRLVVLDQAAELNLRQALAAWNRGEPEAADHLAAGAVVLDVGLEEDLPAALRQREGFRRRGAEMARDLVLTGEGGITPRAAAALVQLAGCRVLQATLEVRWQQGPEIDAAFLEGVTLIAAGCELRAGRPAESIAKLSQRRETGDLSIRGFAVLAAALRMQGASLEEALATFPASYDEPSTRLTLAEALRIARRAKDAESLEQSVAIRLNRARKICGSGSESEET